LGVALYAAAALVEALVELMADFQRRRGLIRPH
jgi:hypothetical protein